MTRREAFQFAAMAVAASRAAVTAEKPQLSIWDGYVTGVMAVDDVRRLAAADNRVRKPVRYALTRNPQLARLGAGLEKPERLPEGLEEEPLAVAAGALICHTVKAALKPPDWLALDAALLANRNRAAKPLNREAYLEYLRAIDLRAQIELHTLDPEESNIQAWLEGTVRWRKEANGYLDKLAGALAAGRGSPAFDPGDPLFALAERVRRAEAVTARDLQEAQPSSDYGRALSAALSRLQGDT